jgi:hypothetical protein
MINNEIDTLANPINCIICGQNDNGYLINTKDKDTKALVCKNCIAKIKDI